MFENITMLAGLGGAVVPLVIHLLGRARYRTVDWGAMMFLDPTTPPWRDGARLREYALLAVRMGAVGLLAVALARPIAGSAGDAVTVMAPADTRVAAAIVIDCSASMGYEGVGRSRMEAARSAALQVISTLRRGDRAALITAPAPSGPPAAQLTGDLQSVAARVGDLQPVAAAAHIGEALDIAIDALDRQERVARHLYVITDQQAQSWQRIGREYGEAWQAGQVPQSLERFVVIPVGGRETDNVALESIELLNPPAVRGLPMQVAVTVRNYGADARAGLPITLRVTGGESVASTLNVGPLETGTVTLPITIARAGSAVLTAEVRDAARRAAGPALDDRREHIVEVLPAIRTLIVRGNAGEHGTEAGDVLSAALAPYRAAGRDGPDLARIETVGVGQWETEDLASRWDVVILDNVPATSDAQAAALEQFVYGGGGLLLAPGPATEIGEHNRLLYRDEDGLMPALLQPPVTPPRPLTIEPSTVELASPVMGFLPGAAGEPGAAEPAALAQAAVERYFPLTGRTPATHVLAALSSGDALLVEQPFGRGRVVMISCGLAPDWSTLPLTNLYLPLLQSTLRYLAAGGAPQRNFSVGDEVVATITPAVEAPRGIVLRPDGTRDACEVSSPAAGRSELRYARTDVPGVYTMRVGPRGAGSADRTVQFSVAADALESDLTPLTLSHWQLLESWLGFSRVEADAVALASSLGESRGGETEYWMLLVAGVLGLFVLELALTRYWTGRG